MGDIYDEQILFKILRLPNDIPTRIKRHGGSDVATRNDIKAPEGISAPEATVVRLYNHSCEAMGELSDSGVDLIVTSPRAYQTYGRLKNTLNDALRPSPTVAEFLNGSSLARLRRLLLAYLCRFAVRSDPPSVEAFLGSSSPRFAGPEGRASSLCALLTKAGFSSPSRARRDPSLPALGTGLVEASPLP